MKRIALSMGLKSFCKKAKVVFYIILLINLYSLLVPHESVCQLVSDFRVNQDTFINVSKDYAKISTNKAGQTVIVWNDYTIHPGYIITGNINAQIFDKDLKRIENNFIVNLISYHNLSPDVAVRNDGSFVITWINSTTSIGCKIFIRIFDATGFPITDDLVVNDSVRGEIGEPMIGCDSLGRIIVVFHDEYQSRSVLFQRFNQDGTKIGNNVKVNEGSTVNQCYPDIEIRKDCSFIISWEDYRLSSWQAPDIFFQMYASDGLPVGVNTPATVRTNVLDMSDHPKISSDTTGNFVIAYNFFDYSGGIDYAFYQRFDKFGTKLAKVELYGTVRSIASDEIGNLIILTDVNISNYNARYDYNNNLIGNYYKVSNEAPDFIKWSFDISLRNNKIINIWGDKRLSSSFQVFANMRSYTNPDSVVSINNNTVIIPDNFKLFQNYPNPFNSSTKIKFEIPTGELNSVTFGVYDILGKKVYSYDKITYSGTYEINLNCTEWSSGIYFAVLNYNRNKMIKRMILAK